MAKIVETSDEWITTRTGIKARCVVENETTSDLAFHAAEMALKTANISAEELDMVILATITPDNTTPSTAAKVSARLGVRPGTIAFDMSAACSGFVYALTMADNMIRLGQVKTALIIGAESLSKITDWTDRNTCVLFGDGAGAAVVQASPDAGDLCAVLGCRSDNQVLFAPGAADPAPSYIHMAGQPVFKFAVDIIPRTIEGILEKAGMTLDQVDWVVLHQANERIIDHVVRKMEIPPEKVFKNIARYGNMSSACIPIALDDLYTSGQLRPGMKLLCVGFGGGLTWGGAMIEFA